MPPAIDETFTYTGLIQTYTVSVTGTYDITAFGAQGGAGNYVTPVEVAPGGEGAEVSADITLTAGTVLDVLVGGVGGSNYGAAGGGGGGSFVVEQTGTVALVVGGGGGGGGGGYYGSSGGPGLAGSASANGGAGGGDTVGGGGGGGGGFSTGGADGSLIQGGGGASYVDGGAGGNGPPIYYPGYIPTFGTPGDGGYGGGGGGNGGGGGGGGYSGGDGGGFSGGGGGGGGSYYIPTAYSATEVSGVETGNGEVTIDLLCFLAGTAIATPGGEVPIEALRVGDLVLTATGRAVPLTWIGRRSVTAATPLNRDLHYPVRIRRDAVAPGIPRRDLLVTGDHAVYVDGHLIPARMLVNGGSIRAERAMTSFTYFHLELERHDLLLAEGLAAECYLDTGNRHMFAGSNVFGLAPPGRVSAAASYAERGVAPLTLASALVEPIWRCLAARAADLRMAPCMARTVAPNHGIHLLADGRRIRPTLVEGERAIFMLTAGVREIAVVSAVARPSDTRPWLDDRRRLGVMVRRIRVHTGGDTIDVALDGSQIGTGWHGVEPAGRWTTGSGALALPAGTDASILELTVAGLIDTTAESQAA